MGEVDVTHLPAIHIDEVSGIEPIHIEEVSGIEPLRIAKIAPAAVHVKELNHIDPITVESLRIDEVRNIDPVKVDRFDVTHLPTVNLTVGETPEIDLNLRRMPPIAVGLQQDFVLPSEYCIRAKLLGFEFLRLHVSGRTLMHPRDQVPREVSSSHERSYREVAASGNPAIPVTCTEEYAEAVVHERPKRHRAPPRAATAGRPRPSRGGGGMRVGAPPHAFALSSAQTGGAESAVGSG